MTKAKLKTENQKYIGNKERSHKCGGVGIINKTNFTINIFVCSELKSFKYCVLKIEIEVSKHLAVLLNV